MHTIFSSPPWSWMVVGQGPLQFKGTVVASGGIWVSRVSMFWLYMRISLPSAAIEASMWWNRVGFALAVISASSRTMVWKDSVDESCLYTDASKRCLPDALSLCCPRRVAKRPVEERKSGTDRVKWCQWLWEVSFWNQRKGKTYSLPTQKCRRQQ